MFVHKLKPEDKLAQFVEVYRSNYAKAVVIVNTTENYTIQPIHLKGLQKSSFPLVVLTLSDGQEVLKTISRQYDEEVTCDIDVESDMDLPPTMKCPEPSTRAAAPNENVSPPGKRSNCYLRIVAALIGKICVKNI